MSLRAQRLTRLWRRRDTEGMEHAILEPHASGWTINATVLLAHDGEPWELRYALELDTRWRTRRASVDALATGAPRRVGLLTDTHGAWSVAGTARPDLAGCLDLDLGFTPLTNTLPIRRLDLPVGGTADVDAAWLRFPALTVERLAQSYQRETSRTYRYRSATGFEALLEVDEEGLVVEYPGFWTAV